MPRKRPHWASAGDAVIHAMLQLRATYRKRLERTKDEDERLSLEGRLHHIQMLMSARRHAQAEREARDRY